MFEAGTSFGGVWADAPVNDVVYRDLVTNLPKQVMQSPDLDFAAELPSYINKEQLGSYIARYAHEFGVAHIAQFNSRVTSIRPVCNEQSGSGDLWRVEWSCGGASHFDIFDAVVVANGHYEEPFVPSLPGQQDWLAADSARSIMHAREYDNPSDFLHRTVLVVGGRSSGVDISRSLRGVAKWIYVLEKNCASPMTYAAEAVTHAPLGSRLCADGFLRLYGDATLCSEVFDAPLPGPPIDTVILATGYVYSFPFLCEQSLGMSFRGRRAVTPLYLHLQHSRRPSLGFMGIQLSVPCPLPFFECQAAYLAEVWALPPGEEMASLEERCAWVETRLATTAATGREQDLHYTCAEGGSAWEYMRYLIRIVQAQRSKLLPPNLTTAEDAAGQCSKATAAQQRSSWIEQSWAEARLATVAEIFHDRSARYPTLPWHDDAYRRCEYIVDWLKGRWAVDASKC